jgi:hypothetical protein
MQLCDVSLRQQRTKKDEGSFLLELDWSIKIDGLDPRLDYSKHALGLLK